MKGDYLFSARAFIICAAFTWFISVHRAEVAEGFSKN